MSQTDNQIGNLCSDFHCSRVFHTFSKLPYRYISFPILLKFVLLCFSCFLYLLKAVLFWVDLVFKPRAIVAGVNVRPPSINEPMLFLFTGCVQRSRTAPSSVRCRSAEMALGWRRDVQCTKQM